MPDIAFLLKMAKRMLIECVEQPDLEARCLLSHVLQKPPAYLMAWPEAPCDEFTASAYVKLLQRRVNGEPIAYIVGEKAFWDITLSITPDVLIPRPETELLLECVLAYCQAGVNYKIAELGVGSGAVVCALANSLQDSTFFATDVSAAALLVARANADRLGLSNVSFYQGNWFDALPPQLFDIIVSNPPYIALHDKHLAQGDLRFEPQIALSSGKDGLDAIRQIAASAYPFLRAGGTLLLEHGFDQAERVRQILTEHGYQKICVLKDLAGHDRVTQSFA